jgi:DNA-binding NarL/FixJ family response regulator
VLTTNQLSAEPRSDVSAPSNPIRVAILEDSAPYRESLASLITATSGFSLVGQWASFGDMVDGLRSVHADVITIDLQLQGQMDGVLAAAYTRLNYPETAALILTLFHQRELIFEALKAGAVGYLLKKSTSAQIVEAIREVAAGGAPMTGEIARQVIAYFQGVSPPVESIRKQTEPLDDAVLSGREREVLARLASGLRYKEVADALGVSHNTVRSHVRRIFQRLHVHGVAAAVAAARARGIVLPPVSDHG